MDLAKDMAQTIDLTRPTAGFMRWTIALFMGLATATLALNVRQKYWPSPIELPLDRLDALLLVISLAVTLLLAGLKTSARIEACSPPLLIKTLLLFGYPVCTSEIRLDKITWVRGTYDTDSLPRIEGGTDSHQIIPIVRMPNSPQHKEETDRLCEEIAKVLNIANWGFDKHL
jgi:hypothetical protein